MIKLKKLIAVSLSVALLVANPLVANFLAKETSLFSFFGQDINNESKENFTPNLAGKRLDSDVVEFTDSNFKKAVIKSLNITDKDFRISTKDITYGEIKAVKELNIDGWGIKDLSGIEYFEALETINISNNLIKDINLSANVNLITIIASNNQLSTIDLSNNLAVKNINISNNDFNNIDLSSNPGIVDLNISNNNLKSIDVTVLPDLKTLKLSNNNIASLDVSKNLSLITFEADNNYLSNIDLSNNDKLVSLSIAGNVISNLNLRQSYPDLNYFYVNKNNLSHNIDLSNSTKLKIIDISDNYIEKVELGSISTLESFTAFKNKLTSLDLSKNTSLQYLDVSYNQLTNLNITGLPLTKEKKTFNNFLPDNQLSPLASNKIKLISKEATIDQNTTLNVTNDIFYVVYDEGSYSTSSYPYSNQLSSNHTISRSNLLIDDGSIDLNTGLANRAGAMKMEYRIDSAQSSVNSATGIFSVEVKKTGDLQPDDLVPFVDDSFKQIIIGLFELTGKSPQASVRDIKYSEVSDIKINHLNFVYIGASDPLYSIYQSVKHHIRNIQSLIGISYMPQMQAITFEDRTFLTTLNFYNNPEISGLMITESNILYANLDQLTKLDVVSLPGNKLYGDITLASPVLTYLDLSYNRLDNIYGLSTSNVLESVLLSYNKLKSLPSFNTASSHLITMIRIFNNYLYDIIDLSSFSGLTDLDLTANRISNVILSNSLSVMQSIRLGNNKISSVNLSGISGSTTYIDMQNNKLQTIDVSNGVNIKSLYLNGNKIELIDISKLTSLTSFYINSNRLKSLDVTQNTSINNLWFFNNYLKNVDLSKNSLLYNLRFNNNQLHNLNLSSLYNFDSSRLFVGNNQLVEVTNNSADITSSLNAENKDNNFILSNNSNQLQFLGDYEISLFNGESIDIIDSVGYVNGDYKYTISDQAEFEYEFISGQELFEDPSPGSTVLRAKQNVSGKAVIKVVLSQADPNLGVKRITSNTMTINVAGSYLVLNEGNANENPDTSQPENRFNIYMYRGKNFRDTGYYFRSASGATAPPLTEVQRKITQISTGKNFMLPSTLDISTEDIDINALAAQVGISDFFGDDFQIEYLVSGEPTSLVRKLVIIDQIGDINQNGEVDANRDASTGILDASSDAGLIMDYVAGVSSAITIVNKVIDLADVNGDGIISLDDANYIKNYSQKTAQDYFIIKQKYNFLIK